MKTTKITLEDQGQDVLELYVDENDVVIDAQPFQASLWRGAMIPVSVEGMVEVGKRCPIHHPPCINYGFLKYAIEAVEELEYKVLKCKQCGTEIIGGYYNTPRGAFCAECWEKVPNREKKKAVNKALKRLAVLGDIK